MNWKVLGVGAAMMAPLVWVLWSGFGADPHLVSNALEGRPAPVFSLDSIDGQHVALADFAGSPLVVNFWATWCQPCALEHPILLEGARRYGPRGVTFLGVLYDDDADKARAFVKRKGQAFPQLIDPGNHTAIDYGVVGVPETFVIDQKGQIVHKFTGPVNMEDLVVSLEALL